MSAEITLESTKTERQIAIIALLAVTLVWGATFIWMKQALDALPKKIRIGYEWSSCYFGIC